MKRWTIALLVVLVAGAVLAPVLYLQTEARTIKADASDVFTSSSLLLMGWSEMDHDIDHGESPLVWAFSGQYTNATVLQANLSLNVLCYSSIEAAERSYDERCGGGAVGDDRKDLPIGDKGLFIEGRGYDMDHSTGQYYLRWVTSSYVVRVSNAVLTMDFFYELKDNVTAPLFDQPWMRGMVVQQADNLGSYLTSNALLK